MGVACGPKEVLSLGYLADGFLASNIISTVNRVGNNENKTAILKEGVTYFNRFVNYYNFLTRGKSEWIPDPFGVDGRVYNEISFVFGKITEDTLTKVVECKEVLENLVAGEKVNAERIEMVVDYFSNLNPEFLRRMIIKKREERRKF